MKTTQKKIMAGALVLALSTNVFAQTNLHFTSINRTDEGAMQLHWESKSNHVYEIDEADSLNDTNTGSITWNKLYDDYPSQGTNTFWLDTGNYSVMPVIPHPRKSPMRFYRIMDKGADDLVSDEPTVSIVSPTSGAVASGLLTITVAAATDQGNVFPKLYVDGQAMWPSQDGSNYVINTCEWANGAHVLFATVDSLTQPDGPAASFGLTGHAVSPFVGVTFSNLISRISFSEESFHPELGQTQQVSALFETNCDWTLTIRDAFSNAVRTVTGSGTSLQFGWDGNGDGGTNIPNGIYYYYISAQPNGLTPHNLTEPNNALSLSSASLSGLQRKELFAIPTDGSGSPVPLAMYPQGFDTNDLTIFSSTPAEIQSLYSEDTEPDVSTADTASFSDFSFDASPSSQSGSARAIASAGPALQRNSRNVRRCLSDV